MSDMIHYKGQRLNALNLYCKDLEGINIYQAYQRPKGDHPYCSEVCHVSDSGSSCVSALGGFVRNVCTKQEIVWRKLNE